MFEDQLVISAIDTLRESGEESAEIAALGLVLLRIHIDDVVKSGTTIQITYKDKLVHGIGVRCFSEPDKIKVTSIISGPDHLKQFFTPDGGFDVAFWNVDEAPTGPVSMCPFDLGCFSGYFPLTMTFEAIEETADLEVIIVGRILDAADRCSVAKKIASEA